MLIGTSDRANGMPDLCKVTEWQNRIYMRIPEDIVEKLNGLPIEAVAQELGLDVKKHKAHCFMHNDQNPSLSFSVSKNMFFCFVCDKGGGPIKLVQEKESWSFQDACVWLGDKFKIWWPKDKAQIKPIKRKIRRVCLPKTDTTSAFDEEIYTWLIDQAKLTDAADIFLFEERRYKKEVINNLKIGSVSDSKKLQKALMERFGKERCLESGLIRDGKYGLYLFFYTPCLLFPYYEQDGKLVGVQSRYLGDKANAPRFQFLSSQKTRLFNLPILSTLKCCDKLYISEGITDCLAMLSAGLNAVAIPSATILPLEDLLRLRNYNLHMYPDQDEAGQKAFVELRRFFVNNYTTVKAEKLPEGIKDYSEYYTKTQIANG